MPLPLGAARRRWRLVVPCSSQRWLCRVPLGGVVLCFAFPQRRLRGLPTPAPDWFVPRSSPKLPPLVPSGAGRGLKVCSSCRRCVVGASLRLPYFRFAPITRFQRIPREVGGDAGGEAAQNRPRRFGAKRVCPESAALGFPPCGGRRPLSIGLPRVAVRGGRLPALAEDRFELWLGQPRARSTACPAWSAPRAAYARRLAATSRRCRSCARPSVCAASLRIVASLLISGAFSASAILA